MKEDKVGAVKMGTVEVGAVEMEEGEVQGINGDNMGRKKSSNERKRSRKK